MLSRIWAWNVKIGDSAKRQCEETVRELLLFDFNFWMTRDNKVAFKLLPVDVLCFVLLVCLINVCSDMRIKDCGLVFVCHSNFIVNCKEGSSYMEIQLLSVIIICCYYQRVAFYITRFLYFKESILCRLDFSYFLSFYVWVNLESIVHYWFQVIFVEFCKSIQLLTDFTPISKQSF